VLRFRLMVETRPVRTASNIGLSRRRARSCAASSSNLNPNGAPIVDQVRSPMTFRLIQTKFMRKLAGPGWAIGSELARSPLGRVNFEIAAKPIRSCTQHTAISSARQGHRPSYCRMAASTERQSAGLLEPRMTDALRYIETIVEPTINDFKAHPTSVRHAFPACVATFHTVDYLTHPRSPATVRQKLRNESPDFRIVDDVAHAFKHMTAGNPKKPVLKAYEVISRPPSFTGVMQVGLSFLGDEQGGVTLHRKRGISLLAAVEAAAQLLRTMATQ
jgi:hypothetical protein